MIPPETVENLTQALTDRSPIKIDGIVFTVTLKDIREPLLPGPSVTVVVQASNGDRVHEGQLFVARERLDDANFPDLCIETMEHIVTGKLPPGTRELI